MWEAIAMVIWYVLEPIFYLFVLSDYDRPDSSRVPGEWSLIAKFAIFLVFIASLTGLCYLLALAI